MKTTPAGRSNIYLNEIAMNLIKEKNRLEFEFNEEINSIYNFRTMILVGAGFVFIAMAIAIIFFY
jgi:hypothetical protein